ncbi:MULTISPECIES: Photosystem I reaction center subunit III [Nostocales]|uniref:Photosystem I reaction center subunit III n=3 Tax=Nostocales TaxID=1161 RepID=A0A0C1R6J6_9CYAN|nr:Photosystem I reaction center subunit III [Tolypothrix bouteillei]KAF3887778.1 Photosystem I reaction center subunit III [Tolypothrix bouteillei VB521301]
MRCLFALVLAICVWFNFTPKALALGAGLVPCKESPAFLERVDSARATNFDPASGEKRFERYSQALCGPEGLPHLIVDGRLDRAGDFLIPSILFLYIAGWIGWVGRTYLQKNKAEGGDVEWREVKIEVPKALPIMLSGFTWPVAALQEFLSGQLTAKDEEIPISPR